MTDFKLQGDFQIPKEFLEGLGVSVFLADPQSKVVCFINSCGVALLGYSIEEMKACQLSSQDLIDPRDREANAVQYARLLDGEISHYPLEMKLVRKSGGSVAVHMTASLVRNGYGEPKWFVAALRELSENHILQQQLAATQRLARLMTWSWDVKSGSATTSGSAIFGSSKSYVSSLPKTLLRIHPDDRCKVEATLRRSVATGIGYAHEYRVINSKGEIRHMQGTATCVLDKAGGVTHLVGATIDVTDTKSLQAAEQVPKAIREVLKYIEMNWNKPIYLADVARQHGISPRAIQRFLASRGMTLTSYVKQHRLRQAHQALSDPKPGTSVTGIALYCGFQNAGHFSRNYREKYSELPSETLRNALRALKSND